MPKMVSVVGLRYLEELRSPTKEDDVESKLIGIELPEVPLLKDKDNPCKWDVIFVCKDGVVYAHRLVIANASVYVGRMFDDQPHWHPTYIYVLDLPRYIVQTLVDLAYTGEMRISDDIQSDVFDAMSTLGWVHTDCLSAHYDGLGESYLYHHPSPTKEEEKAKDTEEVHTSTLKKAPQRKSSEMPSFDDEDPMEMSRMPDLSWSDTEQETGIEKKEAEKDKSNGNDKSQGQKTSESGVVVAGKDKRRGKANKAKSNENVVPNDKGKQTETMKKPARGRGRKASIAESNESHGNVADDDDSAAKGKDATTVTKGKGRGRKAPTTTTKLEETMPLPQPPSDSKDRKGSISACDNDDPDTTGAESPSKRQRRKPKRFEEYEDLDKPKPRTSSASPSKRGANASDTTKGAPVQKLPAVQELSSKSMESNDVEVVEDSQFKSTATPTATLKKRESTKTPKKATKSTLITSYFIKKDATRGEPSDVNHEVDEDDMDVSTEEKREVKKRSFDEILASASHMNDDAVPGDDIHSNENISKAPPTPARKSSRVSSKQSSDGGGPEGEHECEDAPKRKRLRKESVDTSTSEKSVPPPRRSSKQ